MSKNPPVIVQLLGGLGNQMFQHAAAKHFAAIHSLGLVHDTTTIEDHSSDTHFVNRHYELDLFKGQFQINNKYQSWPYNSHGLSLAHRVGARLLRPVTKRRIFSEKCYAFDPSFLSSERPPKYITGNWQSWKYFEEIEDQIRQDFQFRHQLPDSSIQWLISNRSDRTYILHIRRGDYLAPENSHIGFVGTEYYVRACQLAQELTDDPKFLVFSDDLKWCAEALPQLGIDHQLALVEYPKSAKASHIDFQLMTNFNRFIISNSTFAWWAAWLSGAPEKTVIAPKWWFQDESIDTSDLCPPDWIRV